MKEGRYGVVRGEILQLFGSASFGCAFNNAVNAAVKKAGEGWERRQQDKPNPRPRIVSIHGPDGRIIRSSMLIRPRERTLTSGGLRSPRYLVEHVVPSLNGGSNLRWSTTTLALGVRSSPVSGCGPLNTAAIS